MDRNVLNYCISGDLKSLKEISSQVAHSVHKNSWDGQTCLIAACRNGKISVWFSLRNYVGHHDVAQYLIDVHGADVEQVGVVEFEGEQVEGVPPLWCAAAAGHLKLVELLVSRGADVNQKTITNSTALRAACFDGHEEVVKFLVEHGANVEIPNRHGHTCLMISCYRRHDRIVEYLLSKKARVNRRSAKGNTALHDCAESGNLKSLQLLLENRAIMRKDEYGQSPIMSGASAAFRKIVDFLANLTDSGPNQIPDSPAIDVNEKAAAYDLLGASLFDRQSLVQDTVTAWYRAMSLRQGAYGYTKRLNPLDPDCPCSSLLSSNQSTDDNAPGSSWSLVCLAAREAIAMMETLRTGNHHLDSEKLCATCSAARARNPSAFSTITEPPTSSSTSKLIPITYRRKYQKLQSDLQIAYRREVQMASVNLYRNANSISNNSSSNRKNSMSDFPADLVMETQTSYSTKTDFSLPNLQLPTSCAGTVSANYLPSSCSIMANSTGIIQPCNPVDPILGLEPFCWGSPRYRRWPFNRASHISPSFCLNYRTKKPKLTLKQCPSCHMILLPFGTFSNIEKCPDCERMLSSNNAFNIWSLRKRLSMKSYDTNSSAQTTYICSCCYLTTEDHPLLQRLKQCTEEAFGRIREFTTPQELGDMMRNPHALRLQPLLIRLRILGPDHPDTIYFIRYRGAIYADADNFRQCLNLWRYVLDLQRIFLEPLCHVSQAAFVSFAELFHYVLTNTYPGLPAADLDPGLIVDCLELAVDNIERGMDYSFYQWHRRYPWSYTTADKEAINLMRHVALCLHFIAMILTHYAPKSTSLLNIRQRLRCSIPTLLLPSSDDHVNTSDSASTTTDTPVTSPPNLVSSVQQTAPFESSATSNASSRIDRRMPPALCERFLFQVFRLIRLDPRVHRGHSLIHLACSPETSTVGRFETCRFPNTDVLTLLFELGADPNCVDVDGQRPIGHILSHPRLKPADHTSLLETLVRGGAHLDASNRGSLSVLEDRFRHVLIDSKLRVLNHVTLACLAARVAKQIGLTGRHPFVRSRLPENLISFIELH